MTIFVGSRKVFERNTAQMHDSVRFIDFFLHCSGALWIHDLCRDGGVLTEDRGATFGFFD